MLPSGTYWNDDGWIYQEFVFFAYIHDLDDDLTPIYGRVEAFDILEAERKVVDVLKKHKSRVLTDFRICETGMFARA